MLIRLIMADNEDATTADTEDDADDDDDDDERVGSSHLVESVRSGLVTNARYFLPLLTSHPGKYS